MADVTPTEQPGTPVPSEKPDTPLLSNETYNKLKFLVQVVLPAIATLYAGLAVLWGFPHGTEVTGSIALIATFGGALLGYSSRSFNNSDAKYDGDLNVIPLENGAHAVQVALNAHPGGLGDHQTVTLQVQRTDLPPLT